MVSKQEKAKKEWKTLEVEVPLSEGVSAKFENNVLTLTGPKGEVSKNFKYPNVYLEVDGNKVKIGTKRFSKREKKIIFTYRAHVKNMNYGVVRGYEYKLVVVYAKFPMTVEVKGDTFTVKNLLGEKVPRSIKIYDDVTIKVNGGKDIVVSGLNKERVGQMAANLEQLTRITHLDRRVIQDGIFITSKPKAEDIN